MHVNDSVRAAAFMQVIDILRHDENLARKSFLQACQRAMRRVGLRFRRLCAARVVKCDDLVRIAGIALGRGHILDPVMGPEAVFGPEGL